MRAATTADVSTSLDHVLTLSNNVNSTWWKDAGLRKLYFALSIVFVFQATGGMDETFIGGFQAMAPWNSYMGTSNSYLLGLTSSVLFIGEFATVLPGAWLADKYGRRLPLILGAAIQTASAIMNSCANGFALFTFSRAMMGVGIGLFFAVAPVLTQELPHPKHRRMVAAQFNSMWYAGSIIASIVVYGTAKINSNWSWRIPSILQIIPGAFMLAFCWTVPESPRWLVGKGRQSEALAILAKYHANGDVNDELVLYEMAEIVETIAQEESFVGISWFTLFKGTPNLKRVGLLVLAQVANLLSGQSIIAYFSVQIFESIGITSVSQQTGINIGLSIACWFSCLAGGWIATRFPTRWLWMGSVGGMLLCNIPFVVASWHYAQYGDNVSANVVLVFIWLYSIMCNVGMSPLVYAFSSEILPFNLRAIGTGFSQLFACFLLVGTTYLNPVGMNNIGWKFYTPYTAILVITLILIYLYMPETAGRTLEQITAIFEPNIHLIDPEAFAKEHEGQVAEEDDKKSPSSPDTPVVEVVA